MSLIKKILNNTNTLSSYKIPTFIFKIIFFFIILNSFILLYLSTTYLINDIYLDQNDPLIASLSWFFEINKSIYNDINSSERYSGPWGPLIYLFNYFPMKLLGPSIFTSKIFNFLCLFTSIIAFFLLIKKMTRENSTSFFFTGLLSMIYLSTNAAPLSIRNDSLGYLLIIISLFFCLSNNKFKSYSNTVSFGILAAILINLKPQFALCLLPSFFYCLEKNYKLIKIFLIFITTFFVTFYIIWSFENLSLINYILWLQIILNDIGNFTLDIFLKNFWFLLYLIIPLSILFFFNLKLIFIKEKIFFSLLIFISMVFCLYSSRDGGGTADLFILIPYYFFIFFLILKNNNYFNKKELQGLLIIFTIIFLSFYTHSSTKGVVKTIQFIKSNELSKQIKEVDKILKTYPKGTKISIGYGSSLKGYLNLYTRPMLIYNNDYFFVELPHLFLTSTSRPIEDKTLKSISNCINDVYLIPQGELPFVLKNNKEYFSNNLIKMFNTSFKKKESYQFFDVWECIK